MRNEAARRHATPRKNTHLSHAPEVASASGSSGQPNEGEGNRTAARRYDTATEAYIASGRSPAAAKAAADALDGPEAKELREAEKIGKAGHPKRRNKERI
jgi:hypothetical protein